MNNDIGLVVWGTKKGMKIFFSNDANNPILNIAQEKVRRSRGQNVDIRRKVGMKKVDINFYSVEVNKNYMVYNIYKSINDSISTRAGGFLAISLLVPYNIQPTTKNNIFDLLNNLMAIYENIYIDKTTLRITNKNENKELFIKLINDFEYDTVNQKRPDLNTRNDKAYFQYNKKEQVKKILSKSNKIDKILDFKEIFFLPDTKNKNGIFDINPSYETYTELKESDLKIPKGKVSFDIIIKGNTKLQFPFPIIIDGQKRIIEDNYFFITLNDEIPSSINIEIDHKDFIKFNESFTNIGINNTYKIHLKNTFDLKVEVYNDEINSKPINYALIEVNNGERRVRTDTKGVVKVKGLNINRVHSINISAPDYEDASITDIQSRKEEKELPRLKLKKATEIKKFRCLIIVSDGKGKNLKDVEINLPNFPTETTNNEGRVKLPKLNSDKQYTITVSKEGYETKYEKIFNSENKDALEKKVILVENKATDIPFKKKKKWIEIISKYKKIAFIVGGVGIVIFSAFSLWNYFTTSNPIEDYKLSYKYQYETKKKFYKDSVKIIGNEISTKKDALKAEISKKQELRDRFKDAELYSIGINQLLSKSHLTVINGITTFDDTLGAIQGVSDYFYTLDTSLTYYTKLNNALGPLQQNEPITENDGDVDEKEPIVDNTEVIKPPTQPEKPKKPEVVEPKPKPKVDKPKVDKNKERRRELKALANDILSTNDFDKYKLEVEKNEVGFTTAEQTNLLQKLDLGRKLVNAVHHLDNNIGPKFPNVKAIREIYRDDKTTLSTKQLEHLETAAKKHEITF